MRVVKPARGAGGGSCHGRRRCRLSPSISFQARCAPQVLQGAACAAECSLQRQRPAGASAQSRARDHSPYPTTPLKN